MARAIETYDVLKEEQLEIHDELKDHPTSEWREKLLVDGLTQFELYGMETIKKVTTEHQHLILWTQL